MRASCAFSSRFSASSNACRCSIDVRRAWFASRYGFHGSYAQAVRCDWSSCRGTIPLQPHVWLGQATGSPGHVHLCAAGTAGISLGPAQELVVCHSPELRLGRPTFTHMYAHSGRTPATSSNHNHACPPGSQLLWRQGQLTLAARNETIAPHWVHSISRRKHSYAWC